MNMNCDFKKVFEMLDQMEACAQQITKLNKKLHEAVASYQLKAA
ncbi:hypothetical protein NVI2019_PEGOAJLN_00681 [Providencia alcalifaciens]|nr:hypothetical protein [Providencia alcalifaciens]CAG9411139.1 hypothetical protein NVI2019_PEGOAJLN_00681 [Providencia alcalifaciens]